MSKRLEMLEKVTAGGSKDSFAWYALALEYQGAGRIEDAVRTFGSLREIDPAYVPMYLMCGTMLAKAGRIEDARTWLTQGVSSARAKGDQHALGEIESALAGLSPA
jgi:tetratricopeptide (TPR) repeat protein